MNFTNPDDLFDHPSLNPGNIQSRVDRIEINEVRQVGARDININGAILTANVKELKYKPKREPNGYDYRLITGVDILNKTQIGAHRRSIVLDAICAFMMRPSLSNDKCSGIRIGGDDIVYPVSDDGRSVASVLSKCGAVGRGINTPQGLSGLLFKHAQPLLKTNYPLPQPNSVWPSSTIDESPYPTPVKNRIPGDAVVRLTSSDIAGQDVAVIGHKMEILDMRLTANTFPRLKVDPNKKLDIFDNKYLKLNFDNGINTSDIELGIVNKPDFDYGTYYRGYLCNLNTVQTRDGYWCQLMTPTRIDSGNMSGTVWPIHEKFVCSNKHFRIVYDRKRANGEYMQIWSGGGMYSPFKGDPSEPDVGSLAAGDSPEHGYKLPETSCIWAIEGNNNYVEIDIEHDSSIFIGGKKSLSAKHVALVGFLGEGNTVVIRLGGQLKFYGNYRSDTDNGVQFYVMACTNSLKNTVYILSNAGTNLVDRLRFDPASLPSARQQMLRGVMHIDPPSGLSTITPATFPLPKDPIYHGP